jgi:hypothetical protein
MAGDVTPFLSISDFQGMFPRLLTDSETALADLLLEAAAMWIRTAITDAGRDPLAVDDPMAKLVSYEVVRDALAVPGDLAGHLSYMRQSDDRAESGTLAAAGGLLEFTEHHRKMLGLTGSILPQYGGFDSGFGELAAPSLGYANTPAGPVVVGEVVVGETWP